MTASAAGFVGVAGLVGGAALAAFAVLLPVCVGPDRMRAVLSDRDLLRERAVGIAPYVAGLALVLAVNKGSIRRIEAFSFEYGYRATTAVYAIEGDLVAAIQDAVPRAAVYYFGPMYVVGYVVLVAFPVAAYAFAERLRPLKRLVAAYAVNYAVAIACYAGVVAYGPRNYPTAPGADPGAAPVEPLLLDWFGGVTQLTSQVNAATNVFPSLHAALSVTVFLAAVSTHEEFPWWTYVAGALAGSIVVATVFLGIHWVTDVVAGGVLAAGSVAAANRIVG
ncbi:MULTISPECIES: phosphatase PAP2 family protein [Halorubrum]|jgi:membrane-associated phospholipid phosphatase|uniref:phosphatase PAP2 family protein n=1 Tax=Halorubrum TaxID=56688 RepID=UPI0006B2361D|nr:MULTISPECIES: phosphatase PAP2 family protein [Halorubrum]TKX44153.1 phosphatase PAP2 family protein [Halorubrum sp. ARQ200]TKX50939.1 phosphatase PAP2 family protein [Halorubrum sp. ASP121]TKX63486.1 phosphatase PAP2 family protein [Halorubrum sp. ASP1]